MNSLLVSVSKLRTFLRLVDAKSGDNVQTFINTNNPVSNFRKFEENRQIFFRFFLNSRNHKVIDVNK